VVTLLVIPMLAGIAAGYARGGRLGALADLRVRALWLVWLAVALQVADYASRTVHDLGAHHGVPPLALICAAGMAFLALNLRGRTRALRIGFTLLAVGAALNVTAIAANGRMPYSVAAAKRVGMTAAERAQAAHLVKNMPATDTTAVRWLGDVLPVAPIHLVMSLGDLVLLLGIAWTVATGMGRSRPAVRSLVGGTAVS
jgi:hypothetical protein